MNARVPTTAAADDEAAQARQAPLSLGPLAGIVGFHIARAAVTTYDAYDRFIGKPFDLKKVEFSLLMLVQANGEIPPKRLARALAVTAPNLTLLLDRLQDRGLLKRERNPLDGRSQHVVLTDKGRRLARDAAAAAGPMEQELQGRISRAEHAMLIELLGKLSARAAG
jgi:DNA-binding MarR family transcriptional regulator